MTAVRAAGLVKRFGATCAVDGIDLSVAPGEVRGLLGPNGAGKTTLLRLLFGLLAPDAGEIELLGRSLTAPDAIELDGVAGFVEDPRFYPYLTGRANLEVLGEFDGGAAAGAIEQALERVGLADRAEDRVSGYSTGMRQRLGIAAALVRVPRLLLLDEPTSGLDPAGARDIATLVRELSGSGVAVLLSSHQIGEVEAICDTFTVVSAGRVVWDGTAAQLRAQAPPSAYRLATSDDDQAMAIGHRQPGVDVSQVQSGELHVMASEGSIDAFVLTLGDARVVIRRLDMLMSPLESMFFALTRQSPAERDREREPAAGLAQAP